MPISQETIILHDYSEGGVGTTISKRIRTSSRGTKARVTIDVKAEPLVHVFSDAAAGRPVADAYAEQIREDMRNQPMASEATRARRDAMARQWKQGPSPGLRRRFSGGRTGETPPKTGTEAPRKWSHSSRLYGGVVAGWSRSERAFIINKPANRLNQGGELARQFVQDIKSLSNPASAFNSQRFRAAYDESFRSIVEKALNAKSAKLAALRKQQLSILIQAARAVTSSAI